MEDKNWIYLAVGALVLYFFAKKSGMLGGVVGAPARLGVGGNAPPLLGAQGGLAGAYGAPPQQGPSDAVVGLGYVQALAPLAGALAGGLFNAFGSPGNNQSSYSSDGGGYVSSSSDLSDYSGSGGGFDFSDGGDVSIN